MTPISYSEDTLVQQATAEYLQQWLAWESVYAYNNEDFELESLLDRASDREVVDDVHSAREACQTEFRPPR